MSNSYKLTISRQIVLMGTPWSSALSWPLARLLGDPSTGLSMSRTVYLLLFYVLYFLNNSNLCSDLWFISYLLIGSLSILLAEAAQQADIGGDARGLFARRFGGENSVTLGGDFHSRPRVLRPSQTPNAPAHLQTP